MRVEYYRREGGRPWRAESADWCMASDSTSAHCVQYDESALSRTALNVRELHAPHNTHWPRTDHRGSKLHHSYEPNTAHLSCGLPKDVIAKPATEHCTAKGFASRCLFSTRAVCATRGTRRTLRRAGTSLRSWRTSRGSRRTTSRAQSTSTRCTPPHSSRTAR